MTESESSESSSGGAKPAASHASFDPPAEADWHRMISEAAYFIAEKRGFAPGDAAEDWVQAEESVRVLLKKHGPTTAAR